MDITVPTIRSAEELFDTVSVLISRCNSDHQAKIAHLIVQGHYGASSKFVDVFFEAEKAVDEAVGIWDSRHDECRDPDSIFYGDAA